MNPVPSSLFDVKPGGSNLPEFSVTELSVQLKRRVEEAFGHVRVRGEVSQPKLHGSGHLYFTLKDEQAVLAAVCWRGTVSQLKLKPGEGMEVVATGRLTTFAGQSKYQLVVEQLALAGVGALLKMLEDRKAKLLAEGLFAQSHKKPLPRFPRTIGVVTSATGAVIKDILHRVGERFPCRVLLWPVNVQGEGAPAQLVAAIQGFNQLAAAHRPDVLIVARGGGSLEDMLPFYEEAVVRAAFHSAIPLISAIGHETDTCLLDYAADKRAPTPSAAAEMAVPVRLDLLRGLLEQGARLASMAGRLLEKNQLQLASLASRLIHPRLLLETLAQKLDDRAERLSRGWQASVMQAQQKLRQCSTGLSLLPLRQQLGHNSQKLQGLAARLQACAHHQFQQAEEKLRSRSALLESYSYHRILQRGFVLVRDAAGTPILHAQSLHPGQPIRLIFADGSREAAVLPQPSAST